MKKLILVLLILLSVLSNETVKGNEYLTYQTITTKHKSALLLSQYTESQLKQYYDRLSGRRFWGWKTFIILKNEPVKFRKDTLYVIENDGTTPIHEVFSIKITEQEKVQFSATGEIELDVKGTVKGFKGGLQSSIDLSASYSSTTSIEEKFEVKVEVDPQTKLVVSIDGEGKVSNGVGKLFRCFVQTRKGGWEIFTVTTEYYSLKKGRLND